MRFLLVSAQYLPTAGGVERYTHGLAHALAELGHEVCIATSALPGLADVEEESGARGAGLAGAEGRNGKKEPDGKAVCGARREGLVSTESRSGVSAREWGRVWVRRLPAVLALKGRFPLLRRGRAFREAASALWGEGFDLALINTRFYPLALWAARQCRRRGIPAVVVEHGTAYLSLGHALPDLFAHAYEHLAMGAMRRQGVTFYGVSRASSDWLARRFGVKAAGVLYNAVTPAQLAESASGKVNFRARYGIASSAPLLVFSGRFIPGKGVFELLEAMPLLCRRCPDAALLMAGDGPLAAQARARSPAGVVFTGQLPYKENLALLAQADIYVLPTLTEGFPTAVLEAAALGACVVTTPVGGIPELITDGRNGVLMPDNRPATIAAALAALLESPERRRQLGAAAKAEVERRFTWGVTAQAMLRAAEAESAKRRAVG